MTTAAAIYVKHLSDDRVVEVIDGQVCIDGRPEADHLVVIDEHANRQAILRLVPGASHVAGRLTLPQASVAPAALRHAYDRFDGSPRAITERLCLAVWTRLLADGAE